MHVRQRANAVAELIVVLAIGLVLLFALSALAADELKVTEGYQYDKDGRSMVVAPKLVKYDVSGNSSVANIQTITTNAGGEALILGDVTTAGFARFHNLSTNTIIDIGTYDNTGTNLVTFLRLFPEQRQPAWLATTNLRAIAYTNTDARLDYVLTDR